MDEVLQLAREISCKGHAKNWVNKEDQYIFQLPYAKI